MANAQNYDWANGAGGASNDYGNGIATDAAGNEYVTGSFASATITFGGITLTNAGSAGTNDMFIAKYNAYGNILWAKSFGGTGNDNGNKLATDSSNNIYVIGEFASPSVSFGANALANTSAGTNDIFIVKYDSSGNVLWAKSAGGGGTDYGNDITAGPAGEIYITGYFYSGLIYFGGTPLGNTGSSDMYLVKYNSSGNVLWARSSTGANNDAGMGLCTDTAGYIYLTGNFYSPTLYIGSTQLFNTGSSSTNDAFIAKYDSSGTLVWATSAGGTYYDFGTDISTDIRGNVYTTGSYLGNNITFGSITLHGAGASNNDIYVVKYDLTGNVLWARSAQGPASDVAWGIKTNRLTGDVFIAGFFNSDTIWFDSTFLVNTATYSDVFVAKYDSAGAVMWAVSAGGTASDYANDVCVDTSGNCYITGSFASSTAAFGAVPSLVNVGAASTHDVFVARIGPNSFPMGSASLPDRESRVQIYPNPFSASATIMISPELKIQNAELKVYNVFGQEIKSITGISDNKIALGREDIKTGIYFISLIQNNEMLASGKLMITD